MKTLTYTGPSLGVDVPLPGGGQISVMRGQPASFQDDHAASLLLQDVWEEHKPAGKAQKKEEK